VFTARYALSPCIKQIRFVFKGLMQWLWIRSGEKDLSPVTHFLCCSFPALSITNSQHPGQQNAHYCSLESYITISHWITPPVSIPKGSSSGHQIKVTLHKISHWNIPTCFDPQEIIITVSNQSKTTHNITLKHSYLFRSPRYRHQGTKSKAYRTKTN
jgi:hypothetical protein